jgi:hypothetical protein
MKNIIKMTTIVLIVMLVTINLTSEEHQDIKDRHYPFSSQKEEDLYYECEAAISHDYNHPVVIDFLDEFCGHIAWALVEDETYTEEDFEEDIEIIMSTMSK